MRLLLLIVSRRRDELESQTGRHPHTRVASVIYEEELEHPRPTGVGRTRGQFSLTRENDRITASRSANRAYAAVDVKNNLARLDSVDCDLGADSFSERGSLFTHESEITSDRARRPRVGGGDR